MNLRPLHDRVIVRRLVEGEQKSGRIIIPDSAKEKPQRGEVIAGRSRRVVFVEDAARGLDAVRTAACIAAWRDGGVEFATADEAVARFD